MRFEFLSDVSATERSIATRLASAIHEIDEAIMRSMDMDSSPALDAAVLEMSKASSAMMCLLHELGYMPDMSVSEAGEVVMRMRTFGNRK